MSDENQEYTPEELAAAKDQAAGALSAQTGTGPDQGEMTSKVSGAMPDEVNVEAMMATITQMQQQIAALQAEKASQNAPAVLTTAEQLREAVGLHAAGPENAHVELRRLADDAVDAAKNAASSGNGEIVTQIAGKIAERLEASHPGPGDHHWFHQALGFAKVHLPVVARNLNTPRPAPAQALTSTQGSVQVVPGSVTG